VITPQEQQWHWAEGNKYALEAMKALLLLNGGAAIALLTFIGNRPAAPAAKAVIAAAVGNALTSFGAGTISAAVVFILAYATQLHYGNGSLAAPRWHYVAYVFLFLAVAGFVVGICFARTAVIASLL
jgi:hypothetical protein